MDGSVCAPLRCDATCRRTVIRMTYIQLQENTNMKPPAFRAVGSGAPVLFIQGVGCIGDTWAPQVCALASQYRCVSFDNRGIGGTPLGDAPLSIPAMAADALTVMDAQGWESAHLVGHSMGGLIAQHIALSAPWRVRSLALLCTFATGRDVTRPSPRMMWLGLRSRVGTASMRRRAFLRMLAPSSYLAHVDCDALAMRLAPVLGRDLADQPPIAMQQLRAMSTYDALPRLASLAGVRTLVVSAEDDPIAPPRLGRTLAINIPGARYVELADASHGVPVLEPARINARLMEHLTSTRAAA